MDMQHPPHVWHDSSAPTATCSMTGGQLSYEKKPSSWCSLVPALPKVGTCQHDCQNWNRAVLFEREIDSAITNMLNEYEQEREARIARNNKVLADLGLRQEAAHFVSSLSTAPRSRKTRATKVKGSKPVRKSVRQVQPVHSNLCEQQLSGESLPRRFRYTPLRRRVETETMPKRKAEHTFSDDFNFTDNKTTTLGLLWFELFARQPDLKDQMPTCEQLAFNLGEQLLSFETLKGCSSDRMRRLHEIAFTDLTLLAGPEMAIQDVLEHLQQGTAAVDMATERRHGPGQRLANSTFRQFLASTVAKYGDAALEGMEKLCKVPARQAEVAEFLDDTWALVKDKDDAVKRYGTNPCNGKGYNYDFRKVLSRKFDEARKKKGNTAATTSVVSGAGNGENADPNVPAPDTTPAS